MKNHLLFPGLLFFATILFVSCNHKPGNNETNNSSRTQADADTSLPKLIELVEKLRSDAAGRMDYDSQKKLLVTSELLKEIDKLNQNFTNKKSGPIDYRTKFIPGRDTFKKEFGRLISYNMFPTFFQIDTISVRMLIDTAKANNRNVVRMYPLVVSDVNKPIHYSYAFVCADTKQQMGQQTYRSLVIDILDPCPPGKCE